ncbi:MAG: electron transfer flavoprotein-ubiquinone oxidoreductase [Vicinamibacterales bacterium]
MLIVGGGPAGLSAALRLAQLGKTTGGQPLTVAVLEKAHEAGAHMLSGAVLDPSSLRDLVPDYEAKGAPLASPVREDRVYMLTPSGKIKFPFTPPPLSNHGHYIISLNRFVKWLAGLVEAEGVDLFTGFPGAELLMEGARVVGVRTGARGINKAGEQKATFEPGVEIRAKVTILADGVRGNLTKTLVRRLQLGVGRQPPLFAIGIKELWNVPPDRLAAGTVIHTMGYPLGLEQFGGGFIYAMPEGQISLGFVVGLDYEDPMFDPHDAFNRFKKHPLVERLLEGGQLVRYGAKALPEGGWHTIPRCYADGALVVGDAAGFMNSMRLKGIHLAMRSGMLAAETAYEAVRNGDTSAACLQRFEQRVNDGPIKRELYPVRNVHQAFGHGLFAGLAYAGFALLTGGWWFRPMKSTPGHARMEKLAGGSSRASDTVKPDRKITFDKVTNVHYSGTRHDEDQPAHLLVQTDVCNTICTEEYGNPCQRFCPADVYEMVMDATSSRLKINASNCVHCKTCDIMDPYQVITWVTPEGGGGPRYEGM